MPLRVVESRPGRDEEPELAPVPFCDFCGELIRHVTDGVWLLEADRYEAGPSGTAVLFAHHDRTDDRGEPVSRCHDKLEQQLAAEGRRPGWLEFRDFVGMLVRGVPGARQAAAEALQLHERDVWLLRWLAAGMPQAALPGQPKEWHFAPTDVARLAERLAACVAKGTGSFPVDDDMRYGG